MHKSNILLVRWIFLGIFLCVIAFYASIQSLIAQETTLPSAQLVTNMYLYGQETTPDNKVSNEWIRGKNETTSITISIPTLMESGPGRFAIGAQFELVRKFFEDGANVLAPNDESNPFYTKSEVATELGLDRYDFVLDNSDFRDGVNDYGERTFVFGTQSYQINDAKFIVSSDGTVRIEDFGVLPRQNDYEDNFDFDGGDFGTNIGNFTLVDAIDPSRIGRKVVFNYIDSENIETSVYQRPNYESDLQRIAQWNSTEPTLLELNAAIADVALFLWLDGVTYFIDGVTVSEKRPILYGTVETDVLNGNSIQGSVWADANGVPTIDDSAYANNGVVLIGGDGDDELNGYDNEDRLIGSAGNDELDGGDSEDIAEFSGPCREYNFEFDTSIIFDDAWTITHARGSQIDGKDTLKNIEKVQFKDGIFELPANEGATFACAKFEIVLIIDSTGSMDINDPQDKRIEAAKAYLTASSPGDYVAVVDFDSIATLKSGLQRIPEGLDALEAAIDTIDSSGTTNIRDGITVACDELVANGTATKRGAILLTDGEHNVGPFGNPQKCFADKGWPIYTYGFGSADAAFLQTVASDTSGEYTNISQVSNLICEFQRVRAKIAGAQPGPCVALQIGPGQTASIPATVPAGQSQATFSTSWSGSDVVMTLTTPSGRVIDRNTVASDIRHKLGSAFEIYSVTDPEAGNWQASLFGADVPPEGEEVIFGFTTLPIPEPEKPDLVVQQIIATENSLQIVIKNQGAGPVPPEHDFWVDVYINPNTPPVSVNDVWNFIGSEGLVWGVVAPAVPVQPGATVTLSIDDAYYWPSLSNISWPIPPDTPIYAQVDSANAESIYGGVLENHEAAGGAYNNILGPVLSTSVEGSSQLNEKVYLPLITSSGTASAAEDAAASSTESATNDTLPGRP